MARFAEQIRERVQARYPVIYVQSLEEQRVERLLQEMAEEAGYALHTWTCTRGIDGGGQHTDPLAVLDRIADTDGRAIYLLKDYHPFLGGGEQQPNPHVCRRLRDLASALGSREVTVVFVSPAPLVRVPEELADDIVVLDFPLPTVAELDEIIERQTANLSGRVHLRGAMRERFLRSLLGLTAKTAERATRRAIVNDGRLDEADIPLVQEEKRQVIRRTGVLEYYAVEETIEDIGGLDVLKRWLGQRGRAFTEEAERHDLPCPRGIALIGVQGCGKSLVAKSIASLWQLPLLRFDVGRVFGGLVGESEANIRTAINVSEALSPCVLWIDELDKAFAGLRSYQGDSGTQMRVFGSFITWLQEKRKPVFVAATANNPQDLPPELLRRGRIDETFFVDLPGERERAEIFRVHLGKQREDPADFDLRRLAAMTEGFSGAEIEQLIIDARFQAFCDDEMVSTEHVAAQVDGDRGREIEPFVPLSSMMGEQIEELREWSVGRARRASRQEPASIPQMPDRIRNVDLPDRRPRP